MLNILPRISALSDASNQIVKTCVGGVRYAAHKATSGARWQGKSKRRPQHRGLKVPEGKVATAGTTVVKQIHLFCFPGLNVGFGVNGHLYAMETGKVYLSCEKSNVNWNHTWVQRTMADQNREVPFYKIYCHVIPEPQHNRFKLVEEV